MVAADEEKRMMNTSGMIKGNAGEALDSGVGVFDRLLPVRLDNAYRGRKAGLWFFGLIGLMRTVMGVNSILHGRSVASSADGIPLDTYSPAAAQTAVSLFTLLGLWILILCLLGWLVLARYRSAVPLLFTVLLLQYVGGRIIFHSLPSARIGTPFGLYVNLLLFLVMMIGLVLSLGRQVPRIQGV
jgi:hypothetical protein